MESTIAALARVTAFARSVCAELTATDEALTALRTALGVAGVPYALTGSVAVLHHGYHRTTPSIDLLIDAESLGRALPTLTGHGFERDAEARLLHRPTGVEVLLLLAGRSHLGAGTRRYPHPVLLERSPRESDIVSLPALIELALESRRHQDIADVVALIKPLDDGAYLVLEAALPASLRPALFALRRDALDELAIEKHRP